MPMGLLANPSGPPQGLLTATPGPAGLLGGGQSAQRVLTPPAGFWPDATVKALFDRPFTVDRTHTPPYVAGYSNDGHTIYLHRDFPRSLPIVGRTIDPSPYVILHERVEKAFLDARHQTYQTAHSRYATRAEHDALRRDGLSPKDIASYDVQMREVASRISREPNKDIPADLDKQPYRDTGNMAAVGR